MSGGAVPECLSCGACCFGPGPRYVRVTGDDHRRLGDEAERLTQFIEHRCYMRMEDGHCAALSIEASGRFVCSVYAGRPEVCRRLERGSSECQAELIRKRELRQGTLLRLIDAPR
jgi:uncharacterized protein